MKFARHLAAALLAMAVIVALGVAWAHSPATSWIGGGNGQPVRHVAFATGGTPATIGAPAGLRTLPHDLLKTDSGRNIHIRASVALNLPSILDLVRTVVIEAAFIAVVVAIDIARRRRRRTKRTTS